MSALDQLAEFIPPCDRCSKKWSKDFDNLPAYDDMPKSIATAGQGPVASWYLMKLQKMCSTPRGKKIWSAYSYLCDECLVVSKKEARQKSHIEAVDRIARHAFLNGWIPQVAHSHRFKFSDPDIEKQNKGAWSLAGSWTLRRPSLWVCGPPGVGKTFLCHCILNLAMQNEMTAMEASGIEIRDWAQFHPKDIYRRRCSRASYVRILLLEDIDKPVWKGAATTLLWELINKRQAAGLPTIFTANVDTAHMGKAWREARPDNESVVDALADRLKSITIVELKGKSLR